MLLLPSQLAAVFSSAGGHLKNANGHVGERHLVELCQKVAMPVKHKCPSDKRNVLMYQPMATVLLARNMLATARPKSERPKLHSCYASQFAAKPLAIALSLILLAVAHSEALWTCWVVCSTMGMADRSAASGSNSYRAQEKGRKNNPWSFREKTTVGKAKRLRCAFVKRSNSYPRYSSIKLIDLCPAYYKHVVLKTRPVTTYGSQLLAGRRSSK